MLDMSDELHRVYWESIYLYSGVLSDGGVQPCFKINPDTAVAILAL
jgi:hypothetical protein